MWLPTLVYSFHLGFVSYFRLVHPVLQTRWDDLWRTYSLNNGKYAIESRVLYHLSQQEIVVDPGI
jgi:hypothetical protein